MTTPKYYVLNDRTPQNEPAWLGALSGIVSQSISEVIGNAVTKNAKIKFAISVATSFGVSVATDQIEIDIEHNENTNELKIAGISYPYNSVTNEIEKDGAWYSIDKNVAGNALDAFLSTIITSAAIMSAGIILFGSATAIAPISIIGLVVAGGVEAFYSKFIDPITDEAIDELFLSLNGETEVQFFDSNGDKKAGLIFPEGLTGTNPDAIHSFINHSGSSNFDLTSGYLQIDDGIGVDTRYQIKDGSIFQEIANKLGISLSQFLSSNSGEYANDEFYATDSNGKSYAFYSDSSGDFAAQKLAIEVVVGGVTQTHNVYAVKLGFETIWGKPSNAYVSGDAKLVFAPDGGGSITGSSFVKDILIGSSGNDRISNGLNALPENTPNIMLGRAGNDIITGGDGVDTIEGGVGEDAISSYSGDDNIDGGADNDTIDGGDGNDTIKGGSGDDTINGGDNDDDIDGGADNDTIDGGGGKDLIVGGSGNDTILVSEGDDTIYGGSGIDTMDFTPLDSFLNNDVDVNLITHRATIKYLFNNDTQNIFSIENIKTGGGDDNIIGDDLGNNIETGDGENTVSGNGGSDIIKGGSERDILNGNAGVDIIEGGAGNDTIDGGKHGDYLYGDAGVDTIIGGSGADNIYGGSDGDIISGGADGDYIYGEGGADEIDGGSGNDTIYGGLGVDVIEGGIGIDTIYGGDHGDYLYGDSGNDIIRGESGIDHIYGGADDNATDTLSGGADSDTYIFNGNFGSDIIDDSGSGDKIQIDGSILSGSARVIEETDSGAIIYRIGHIIITKPASGSSLFLSSGSNTITINNFDNGDYGFFRKENANSIFRKNENFVEDKISGTDFPRTSELIEKRIEVFLTKNLDSLGLNIDNENLTNQNKRVFYA